MTTIDSTRRREIASHDGSTDDRAPTRTPASPPVRAHEGPTLAFGVPETLLADFARLATANMREHVEGASASSARASVEATSPAEARERATQARLDAFRQSTLGPYRVGDTWVEAAPQFRMNGGWSDQLGFAKRKPEVRAICAPLVKRGELSASGVEHALLGRGSPSDVCRATQALLDAGKLVSLEEMQKMYAEGTLEGPVLTASLSDRIRATQWKYGIGFDCAGYSQRALLAAHGIHDDVANRVKLGLAKDAGNENFERAQANPRLVATSPEKARSGDVVSLLGLRGDVGHVVIVYAHERGEAAVARAIERLGALDAACGRAAEAFASGRDVDVYEVDSSWGADRGATYGGVRRDTWLYDRETKTWAYVNPHGGGHVLVVGDVPAGEGAIAGIYRPKAQGANE